MICDTEDTGTKEITEQSSYRLLGRNGGDESSQNRFFAFKIKAINKKCKGEFTMKSKRNLLLSLLLCCIMVLGTFTITVSASTGNEDPMPFSFEVDKIVVKGGDVTPGSETFKFELEYGTVGENDQHSVVFTPDNSVTLADCGIAFTSSTITTDGAGKQTFTLGGTVDPTKVDAAHHWQDFTGNDGVPKQGMVLRLTEKNDGKAGWTYSDVERYLTITVKGNTVSTDVGILGNDVYDNDFENIYTAYSFTVKKTDVDGNPLAGAVFSLTSTGSTTVQNFEATSDANGIATFNVTEGNYVLSEKTAPEGYVKSDKTYTLAVRNDNAHTTLGWGGDPGVYFYDENEPDYSNYKYLRYEQVTFINEAIVVPAPTYQFTVKKTDAAGKPLAGATFALTGTGNSIGKNFEAVSDANGIATFDVPEGFYTLSEKTAPKGYIKTDKTYGIAIWDGVVHFYNEDAETDAERYSTYQQVTFINTAKSIPKTGDNSNLFLWTTLLFVFGCGFFGTTIYSKKKKGNAE